MQHVSLFTTFLPNAHLKGVILTYFMTPEQKQQNIEDNKLAYQRQLEVEKTGSMFQVFFHSVFTFSRHSPWYSLSNLLDLASICTTLAAGIFTSMLFIQTVRFVRAQSSLIDDTKLRRAATAQRERGERPSPMPSYQPLSHSELCQALLGQPSLSLYCLIPVYPDDRSVEKYIEKYITKYK